MTNKGSSTYSWTKKVILLLAFLNIFDGISTSIGLHFGIIEEANPLLSSLEPMTILIIKFAISSLLLLLFFAKFPIRKEKFWFILFLTVLVAYFVIALMHLAWIFIYFF